MNAALAERAQRIFEQRMQRLAAAPPEALRQESLFLAAIFLLGKEKYAIAVDSLREVASYEGSTPVPGAPPEILGVINHRGDIRPVFSLKRLLALPQDGEETGGHVLFLERAAAFLGFRADRVIKIESLRRDQIAPASGNPGAPVSCLQGWTPEGVTLLDTSVLLQIDNRP